MNNEYWKINYEYWKIFFSNNTSVLKHFCLSYVSYNLFRICAKASNRRKCDILLPTHVMNFEFRLIPRSIVIDDHLPT